MPRKPASPKPPRRSPGRPAGQPGQRERILDAATELFSRQGVPGTPVKAIAALAGVTPALVHYYFGDRDLLLDAVIDEKVEPLVARFFAGGQPDDEPLAMLVGIATRLIRAVTEAPWFPGLWIREVASDDGALRERVLKRFALERAGALMAPLAAAIGRGQLNPGLEPALVVPSLVGLTLLPLATTHIWRRLPGAEAVDTDALVRHVTALLTHGLSATPATAQPKTLADAAKRKGRTARHSPESA
ncbi:MULTISPECIES: TetR/AcrR family transcriptional regulator [Cupriavidus]|uniref:TetR family transcriptional regulator n=1 Tax=Cupriavidus taiwanensis TaxID=164546 RepID=A0A9Q7UM37_9BURK|nr:MULTISPECIES: TetR/AcrR family transcriptional regulator [Cupriavidus]MEC3765936.1 TetR/AcrR family transcriptional regulator [Cupriavidus sp. SS-3]SPD63419.1 TetR family transcriptional regulator [Cupriavidus taiwanensis]